MTQGLYDMFDEEFINRMTKTEKINNKQIYQNDISKKKIVIKSNCADIHPAISNIDDESASIKI